MGLTPKRTDTNPELSLLLAFLVFRPFETLPSSGHYSSEIYWFKSLCIEYGYLTVLTIESAAITVGSYSLGHYDCSTFFAACNMFLKPFQIWRVYYVSPFTIGVWSSFYFRLIHRLFFLVCLSLRIRGHPCIQAFLQSCELPLSRLSL